jgi:HD-like signal output (HDOD) protein
LDENAFLAGLEDAIAHNEITLPTLPEVALRVRDAMDKEDSDANEIARIVSTDASVSARLLQVANSPMFRGRMPMESVQMAIARLGTKQVRALVSSLAMRGIFQASSSTLDHRFRRLWEDSVEVAAIACVIAKPLRHLEAEQALLAGLIHEIGALPVLVYADLQGVDDEQELDGLLKHLGPRIGSTILKQWGFPPSLVAVTEHYSDFAYEGGPQADYADVVIVARLQALLARNSPEALCDWSRINSFDKVGMAPDVEVVELEGAEQEMSDVRDMLHG